MEEVDRPSQERSGQVEENRQVEEETDKQVEERENRWRNRVDMEKKGGGGGEKTGGWR